MSVGEFKSTNDVVFTDAACDQRGCSFCVGIPEENSSRFFESGVFWGNEISFQLRAKLGDNISIECRRSHNLSRRPRCGHTHRGECLPKKIASATGIFGMHSNSTLWHFRQRPRATTPDGCCEGLLARAVVAAQSRVYRGRTRVRMTSDTARCVGLLECGTEGVRRIRSST